MEARIRPLHGKYYGTIIELGDSHEISVWIMGGNPSEREVEAYQSDRLMTYEEALEFAKDDLSGENHYETVASLTIAKAIVEAVERLPSLKELRDAKR